MAFPKNSCASRADTRAEYLYTWKVPEVDDVNVLIEILELADCWSIPFLPEAIQVRIINLGYISVDTYRSCRFPHSSGLLLWLMAILLFQVRTYADKYRAVILQEACNVFETENQHEIQMFEDRIIP